jgi:Zn-dependent peptidase ImmA (M78 family)/transcriptional regulator with XRE-family HTH domain
MPETVTLKPELIRWAVERSQLPVEVLETQFPRLDEWKRGEAKPTMRQLERLAQKTMTPLGYFFLSQPPDESLPIPDFRTAGDKAIGRPSPNLIETLQTMQRRQAWMREFVVDNGQARMEFVGSTNSGGNIVSLAANIRSKLGLDAAWAEALGTWEDALRILRSAAERIGIFVSSSGFVGLNTHRTLAPQEFRGFVLCDDYVPLVFVNAADSKSARMFTLAHELVHVWIGQGGLFNLIKMMPHDAATERFCNQVAAELLVPAHKLKEKWTEAKAAAAPFKTIARIFKVSPVVAARRALDLGMISKSQFFSFYEEDQNEWLSRKAEEKKKPKRGGPNFYDVQDVRLGRRFAYAVVQAAREGRLLYRDAYLLTDLKGDTFNTYANRLVQRMKDERR